MDDKTFAAAMAEHHGVKAPAAPGAATASNADPMKVNPATGRLAGLDMPARSVAPTPEKQAATAQQQRMSAAAEINPDTGKLQGLELEPDAAQAQADAMLDDMRTPPATPAGYTDPPLPAEFRLTKEASGEFRELAHGLALGNGQYQQCLVALTVAAQAGKMGVPLEKYSRAGETSLRKLWGDAYPTKLALAQSVAGTLMERDPHARELLSKTHAGSSPTLIRILAEIGERRSR